MTIKTLENIEIEELRATFNAAFSDYEVKTELTIDAFTSFLRTNSVDIEISTGLFNSDKLVGFILIGRREEKLYDSGTAIIKEYRGKGYAKDMLSFTIQMARERGYSTFELEVLKNNERAINLYSGFGFKKKAEYVCFNITSLDGETIALEEKPISLLKDLEDNMKFKPSWQNSYQSADTNSKLFTAEGVFIAIRNTGSVLSTDSKDYKTLKAMIATLLKSYQKLRFVNQDITNPMITELIKEKDIDIFTYQYRMELAL